LIRSNLLIAVTLAFVGLSGCRAGSADVASAARTVPLTIKSAGKVHKFAVEVARSEAEQERGLMFRDHLSPNGGMIFPMNPPRPASFWMKNTLIPLDMIFIRADGSIARVAAETVPYSLEPVSSGEPVAAVLEIAGGRAGELGIVEDDKVDWPR
jgi:uncharacterized protein